MLQRLLIRNFVIVSELELFFTQGLNVMTGETGAGKSLIIAALNGLMGARTSADVIRQNADYAYLEATLLVTAEMRHILQHHGFDELLAEPTLLLSKTIQRNNARFRLNGQLVHSQLVKELGHCWLDILSQHESQQLFHVEHHRALLDQMGDDAYQCLLHELLLVHAHWQTLYQERNTLIQHQQDTLRQLDFLRFQLDEIEQADLQPNEEALLQEEHTRLSHADKLIRNLQLAYFELYGREDVPSLCDRLREIERLLANSCGFDSRLEPLVTDLGNIHYQLQDMAHQVKSWADDLPTELNRQEEIHERLNVIRKLKHKYGASIPDILSQAAAIQQEIQAIQLSQERLEQLEIQVRQAAEDYHQLAGQIRCERQKWAKLLAPRLEKELHDLGLTHTQFVIEIQSDESRINPTGYEQVEFHFSPNPGEPPRPLAQIASGGELSRLMLAVKLLLSHGQGTLVFDEVDTGISGKTALALSHKLARLSQRYQLICITHLPVIAAMADSHYWIEKRQDEMSTEVEVYGLQTDERHERLAQMSGGKVTVSSLRHARDLCHQAEMYKSDLLQVAAI